MSKSVLKNLSFFLFLSLLCLWTGCNKKNTEVIKQSEPVKEEAPAPETPLPAQEEKKLTQVDEYKKMIKGQYAHGVVALYDAGYFYDIPENFPVEKTRIFSLDDYDGPLEEKLSEISIKFEDGLLRIFVPVEIHNKYPELYVEAEHDGEKYTNSKEEGLYFSEMVDVRGETGGFESSAPFENRNLYSKDDNLIIRLKVCKTDEVIFEKEETRHKVECNYVVYEDEYKSPFKCNITRLNVGEKVNLIYKGKGSTPPESGDRIVFSYAYYDNGGIAYIPFATVKTKTDTDGVCSLGFAILEKGQYKIDLYSEETGEITRSSVFDYLYVTEDILHGKKNESKRIKNKGAEWKVNSPEGLRLRTHPWGTKIGLIKDGAPLIQTEETEFCFYDFIDGVDGFWIPVKIMDSEAVSFTELEEKPHVIRIYDETQGWVFSGFLEHSLDIDLDIESNSSS